MLYFYIKQQIVRGIAVYAVFFIHLHSNYLRSLCCHRSYFASFDLRLCAMKMALISKLEIAGGTATAMHCLIADSMRSGRVAETCSGQKTELLENLSF